LTLVGENLTRSRQITLSVIRDRGSITISLGLPGWVIEFEAVLLISLGIANNYINLVGRKISF
jgi:hypothetical protein